MSDTNMTDELSRLEPRSSTTSAEPPASQAARSAAQNRRRRGVGIVTANACTECRKKRAKCDGNTPCQRCANSKTSCIYEAPVRMSKDSMREEIHQLQQSQRQAERVFGALAGGYMVDETLNRLRNGQTFELVSQWLEYQAQHHQGSSNTVSGNLSDVYQSTLGGTLKLAESMASSLDRGTWPIWRKGSDSSRIKSDDVVPDYQGEDIMNWQNDDSPATGQQAFLQHESYSFIEGNSPSMKRAWGRGQTHILGEAYLGVPQNMDVSTWTTVTDSPQLVDHLMTLYFCWEYPTFATVSKEHFLMAFRSGSQDYCSSLLVNAMCALGCRFSSLAATKKDPNNVETSGDHFFEEAERLLVEDDHLSLTTIQALGLMAIREASCGRDTESFYFAGQAIRLCVEKGLHLEANDNDYAAGGIIHEVRSATFWGAFALDQAWSLSVGRLPHLSRTSRLVAKPTIVQALEDSEWVPYSDDGTPQIKEATQPSNVRSVFRCFAELSELVHQSLYTLHTPGRVVRSHEIVSMYFRYLNWYSALPEALRLGQNFTPAVLFVHMYYQFALLLLLRPFVKLRFLGSGVSARDVCAQAASAIAALIRSYDEFYSLARTPSFVPYIVLAASVMQLVVRVGDDAAVDAERAGTSSINTSHTMSSHASDSTLQQSPKEARQEATDAILRAAKDLKLMSRCHGFSRRALDITRYLAERWGISSLSAGDSPESTIGVSPAISMAPDGRLNLALGSPTQQEQDQGQSTVGLEQLKFACRKKADSLNMFCPEMASSFDDTGPETSAALFSPFPMQGLPMMCEDDDAELRRHGFERLVPGVAESELIIQADAGRRRSEVS